MKTRVPRKIDTIAKAKEFMAELHKNDEFYHCEDDAHDIIGRNGFLFTNAEANRLNKAYDQIYELDFDPCEYGLELINN